MHTKKGVYMGLLLLVGVLFVSSLVFGQEDPDLSPFDATVTIENAPPSIVNFEAVVEEPNNPGTPLGEIQGLPGGTEGPGVIDVRFKFTVEDPNGPSDLPGCINGGDPPCGIPDPDDGTVAITVGTNVIVTFTEPANDANPGTNTMSATIGSCFVAKCSDGLNPDCDNAAVDGGTDITLQKQYICDVVMNYFDPPSPNGGLSAADRWTILAQIFDSTGTNNDLKQSGDFSDISCNPGGEGNDCDYILYRDIQAISTLDSLSWANLDINAPDQPADSGLILDNVGNIAVADELVTGQDLVEPGNPANGLAVAAFGAGVSAGSPNTGACDAVGGGGAEIGGINLIDNVAVTVTVPITYTADGTDSVPMFFCAWDIVNPTHIIGNAASSYVASVAEGNAWNVVFNS